MRTFYLHEWVGMAKNGSFLLFFIPFIDSIRQGVLLLGKLSVGWNRDFAFA